MSRKKPDAPDVLPVDPNDVPFPHPFKDLTFAGHTREALEGIYKALSAPFPEDAIQRTKKADTKKGYDTTGIGYQYVVNRFNEVLGIFGWGYEYRILNHDKGTFASGKEYQDITAEVTVKIRVPVLIPGKEYHEMPAVRTCVGGHVSATYADALKGAITNGLKKTAALFGVGKGAYEGTLDDDAQPLPEEAGSPRTSSKPPEGKPPEGHAGGSDHHQHPQVKAIHALYDRLKIPKEERHDHAGKALNFPVTSFNDLSTEYRGKLITILNGLSGGKG